MLTFLLELRRRSVFRVAGGYMVVTWLVVQLALAFETALQLPDWFASAITVALLIGFPVAIIVAWAFELTPDGIKRTEEDTDFSHGREHRLRFADGVIAAALVAVVGLMGWNMTRAHNVASLEIPIGKAVADAVLLEEKESASDVPTSIAVLPFADMSAEGDQAYFSDGVAEEITNALNRVPGLLVAARTSAFSYRGTEMALPKVGQELGVSHVLEGSVRRDGDNVRIAANLIEVSNGFSVWGDTRTRQLDDIFLLQDDISQEVAEALSGMLTPNQERLAAELTDSTEAYLAFLRGRDLVNKAWGVETMPNAVSFLQHAVELDPEFAEAWRLLAYANFLLPTYSRLGEDEPYLAASREAAGRAITLDPLSPDNHSMIATLLMAENKFVEALRRSQLMQTLGSGDPEADYAHGYRLSVIGNATEAHPFLQAAVRATPENSLWQMAYGVNLLNLGQTEAAQEVGQRALDQGFPGAAFLIADAMLAEGDARAAFDYQIASYDRISYIAPEFRDPEIWQLAGQALYLGNRRAQDAIIGFVDQARADPDQPMRTSMMNAYLSTGRAETFMEAFMSEPYANGSYVLSRLWDGREATTAIRTHPDFPQWADEIGLVKAWQEFGWPEKCTPNEGTDGSGGQFSCV